MAMFWVLFGLDLIAALLAVGFFLAGLGDGSVSSFNMLLWLGLLAVTAGAPVAGWVLRGQGRRRAAMAVMLPTAVPMVLGAVVVGVLIVSPPDWR